MNDWTSLLEQEKNKPYWTRLEQFVESERGRDDTKVYPQTFTTSEVSSRLAPTLRQRDPAPARLAFTENGRDASIH